MFETRLPGVGVRYEFVTADGDQVGVVVRRGGRRELLLYDRSDPDAARQTVELTPPEATTLVELLGGTKVTERLSDLRHDVEGLSIEWVPMPASGGLTGRTIGDGEIRSATGASVVAVIRGERSIPGPGPDFAFEPGDVVLVIGTVHSVELAAARLTS